MKLDKFKIAKLTNAKEIKGGNNDTTGNETIIVKTPKCKDNSRVWEQE